MALISSAQAGLWSATTTWVGGVVPVAGDSITISHTVTVDDVRTVGVDGSTNQINSSGTLSFVSSATASVTFLGGLRVLGKVEMGKTGFPITGSAALKASVYVGSGSAGAFSFEGTGSISALGVYRKRHTLLSSAAASGATSIIVGDATGWQIGDQLAIACGTTANSLPLLTTITGVSGNTISVTALGQAAIATVPVVNITSNVYVGAVAPFPNYSVILHASTSGISNIENAQLDSRGLTNPGWSSGYEFSNVNTTNSAIHGSIDTAPSQGGGARVKNGTCTGVAFVSSRTSGSAVYVDSDANLVGCVAMSGRNGSGYSYNQQTPDAASVFPILGGGLTDSISVGGADFYPSVVIIALPVSVNNLRCWSWGPSTNVAISMQTIGGTFKNVTCVVPGTGAQQGVVVAAGRIDTVGSNITATIRQGSASAAGSWLNLATSAYSTRGSIVTGAPPTVGLLNTAKIVGVSSFPLVVTMPTAFVSGRVFVRIYRDSGANQTITFASSLESISIPSGTGQWHEVSISAAAGDVCTITSTGAPAYWVLGALVQGLGANLRTYGYVGTGVSKVADPAVTISLSTALTLPVSINHSTQTISISGPVTTSELWHACLADLCKTENLSVNDHMAISGGIFTTSYNISISGAGSITGVATAANGKTMSIVLNGLTSSRVAIVDDSSAIADEQTITGSYEFFTPFGSSGTWAWVVKRPGYEHARGTFLPSTGGVLEITPSTPQKLTPEGSPMFTASVSGLVSVNIGFEAEILIGNGVAPLQDVFNATEASLTTSDGMQWIAGGGEDCSIFNSSAGDYLFMTSGWRLKRNTAFDDNAAVNAFVISSDGAPVDGSNGPVAFLSSDSPTAIASATEAQLKKYFEDLKKWILTS